MSYSANAKMQAYEWLKSFDQKAGFYVYQKTIFSENSFLLLSLYVLKIPSLFSRYIF